MSIKMKLTCKSTALVALMVFALSAIGAVAPPANAAGKVYNQQAAFGIAGVAAGQANALQDAGSANAVGAPAVSAPAATADAEPGGAILAA